MLNTEELLAHVARRAYELAYSGQYADFVSIQEAIMDEGYAEGVPWLERDGIIEALQTICDKSRPQLDA